jgi:hypothetical protein
MGQKHVQNKEATKMVGQNTSNIILWKTLTKRLGYKRVFKNQVNLKNVAKKSNLILNISKLKLLVK